VRAALRVAVEAEPAQLVLLPSASHLSPVAAAAARELCVKARESG
jgi:hypothetical protein